MNHKGLADNTDARSLASRLRRRRFRILAALIRDMSRIPGPITILDIGGTQRYWDQMVCELPPNLEVRVTLLNTEAEARETPGSGFVSVVGDATSMPQFADHQFHIVFSNSTLEHLGSLGAQQAMVNEARRLGRVYCVQTPNRYFPLEPHFLFPFFQFLPLDLRAWLLQRRDLGWYTKAPDRQTALSQVSAIRLLSKGEMRRLFPEATIFEERFLGLVKSFVAYTRI
jgi:hypothetical protein